MKVRRSLKDVRDWFHLEHKNGERSTTVVASGWAIIAFTLIALVWLIV